VGTFSERQKARQDRLTPEKILEVANRAGLFSVSLRHRDDWLRGRCKKLCLEGKLKKLPGIKHGHFDYVPRKDSSCLSIT
jgi:hypothetical protein